MNLYLQSILIVGSVLFALFIFRLVRKSTLDVKYCILWFSISLIYIIFAVFPKILGSLARLLHIVDKVNMLYLVSIFVLLIVSFIYNILLSKQSRHIKRLIQEISLLKQNKQAEPAPNSELTKSKT